MENKFYTKFTLDNEISIVVQSPDSFVALNYKVGHKKTTRTMTILTEFDLSDYQLSKPYETNILIQSLNEKVYGK